MNVPSDRLLTPGEVREMLLGIDCDKYVMLKKYLRKHYPFGYYANIRDTIQLFNIYSELVRNLSKKGNVYNLGESLDKIAFAYNVLHDTNIPTIPLSGNMYNDDMTVDERARSIIDHSIPDLLENNQPFGHLVSDLKRGIDVAVTDYGLTGKGFLTFDYILSKAGVTQEQKEKLLLFVQFTMDRKIVKNVRHSRIHNFTIIVTDVEENEENVDADAGATDRQSVMDLSESDLMIDPYLTNSELYSARCIPKYGVQLWKTPMPPVYQDNYKNCNLNRLTFSLEVTENLGRCE